MSRSRRKTKKRGITTASSEKRNKRIANRGLRRLVKQKLSNNDEILPALREVSNVWSFEKDGKIYDKNMKQKDLRK